MEDKRGPFIVNRPLGARRRWMDAGDFILFFRRLRHSHRWTSSLLEWNVDHCFSLPRSSSASSIDRDAKKAFVVTFLFLPVFGASACLSYHDWESIHVSPGDNDRTAVPSAIHILEKDFGRRSPALFSGFFFPGPR